MLKQKDIAEVIDAQKARFVNKTDGVVREMLPLVSIPENFVGIVTGVRRCGKSTMLLQVLRAQYQDTLYLNFEDIRLTAFKTDDFIRLEREIQQRASKVLFFDEMQLIEKWEVFVHHLLNDGYRVFVTGSNATLLSKEMGTHLTGRHISMELFPFSYTEFLLAAKFEASTAALEQYICSGGMPEYVKHADPRILQDLVSDILVRDIAVRYGVRDVQTLKQVAIYLLNNVGKPVSANNLAGVFGIKSATTILEYFAYYQDCYLVEFVPQFSYSLKAQSRNPKKVYAIDNGFIETIALNFSDDLGRKLENSVYQHLRRSYKELFFFKDKNECDFVVVDRGHVVRLVQVCFNLHDENFDREYDGLLAAMKFFGLQEGTIVTFNQRDEFNQDGLSIKVITAGDLFCEQMTPS